jgi:hypothetical protein
MGEMASWYSKDRIEGNIKNQKAGIMVQGVECLPNKLKALSSNLSQKYILVFIEKKRWYQFDLKGLLLQPHPEVSLHCWDVVSCALCLDGAKSRKQGLPCNLPM